MANDLNQCNFIGRLGRDPETRHMGNGDPVCNFSIAVGWKTKEKEGVEWVNCVAYGKLAEICDKYLRKGSQVYISGRFKTRKWQDKATGADRYSTEINVEQMQMLGGKQDSGEQHEQAQQQQAAPDAQSQRPPADNFEDDIPF